jgi:hypothetical protein
MAVEELADLVAVDAKLKALKAELKAAVLARDSHLMDIHGIGPAGAARSWPTSVTSPASRPGRGSRPGRARPRWTPRPGSRSGTGCPGPGTAG